MGWIRIPTRRDPRPLGLRVARVARTVVAMTLAVGALFASSGVAASATTRPITPRVLPPWSTPGGLTYGQWSGAQWQWEIQQPDDPTSPVVDPNAGTASDPEAV